MKQILCSILAVFSSIIIGTLFMSITNEEELLPVNDTTYQAKTFTVGVFDNIEDAEEDAESKNGVVMTHDNKYYVYVAILKSDENIEHMINYLDNENIYYYVSNIMIDASFSPTLLKYEELMLDTSSDVAFIELNKRLLERFKDTYEN